MIVLLSQLRLTASIKIAMMRFCVEWNAHWWRLFLLIFGFLCIYGFLNVCGFFERLWFFERSILFSKC